MSKLSRRGFLGAMSATPLVKIFHWERAEPAPPPVPEEKPKRARKPRKKKPAAPSKQVNIQLKIGDMEIKNLTELNILKSKPMIEVPDSKSPFGSAIMPHPTLKKIELDFTKLTDKEDWFLRRMFQEKHLHPVTLLHENKEFLQFDGIITDYNLSDYGEVGHFWCKIISTGMPKLWPNEILVVPKSIS